MGCPWLYLVTLATLLELFLGLSLFPKKMCTVLSHLRRESHGKTGKGDVMPGVRRDEMEEMEEDEMDAMDNVKSGETGVMNGVVSTRAVGKVSLFFFRKRGDLLRFVLISRSIHFG